MTERELINAVISDFYHEVIDLKVRMKTEGIMWDSHNKKWKKRRFRGWQVCFSDAMEDEVRFLENFRRISVDLIKELSS